MTIAQTNVKIKICQIIPKQETLYYVIS